MALVAISLLASCSKETPELQPKQVEQGASGVTAVDPSTPGAIRLSLDADVAPFEVAQESYSEEEAQAARGARIDVGGPDIQSAITYRITPGADGKVPVLAFVYDNAGSVQVNGAKGTVTKDGKGLNIKFGTLLDPKVESSNSVLKRIAEGTAKNPRLSILVGQDDDNEYFTNKGPQLITYEAGKTKTLPDNFILMKATGIPLKYDAKTNLLSVANGASVSLTMQGYLIGARFENTFPAKMVRHGWRGINFQPQLLNADGMVVSGYKDAEQVDRPPVDVVFRIENLSATYKGLIEFNRWNNRFDIGEALLNTGYGDPNIYGTGPNKRTMTPGLAVSHKKVPFQSGNKAEHGNRERELFLDATDIGEFFVPIRTLDRAKFSEGEQFVLVYCPNPRDAGSVAYKSPKKHFYDDSPFSMIYKPGIVKGYSQGLQNQRNSFKKRSNLTPDNKFHFVTFTLAPKESTQSTSIYRYEQTDAFNAYKAVLDKYHLNHGQKRK